MKTQPMIMVQLADRLWTEEAVQLHRLLDNLLQIPLLPSREKRRDIGME